ncbi:MAG TPA: hypothetical protein VF944_05895 [Candidatus Bathyarchaeia archaeon]
MEGFKSWDQRLRGYIHNKKEKEESLEGKRRSMVAIKVFQV